MRILKTIGRRLKSLFAEEAVIFRGMALPPRNMRFGGAYFLDDASFLSAGEKDARKLVEKCGLTSSSDLLDVGCGTGRLPLGIVSVLHSVNSYQGVDVSESAIEWCERFITPRYPAFRFQWINAQNERYNPSGADSMRDVKLPFPDSSFDIVHLYSVFSHMRSEDVRAYIKEFSRLLRPGGRVFVTAFIEDNVPNEMENPPDYQRTWKGALHCVRFSRSFFLSLAEESGFSLAELSHGTETDGQSACILVKP